MPLRRGPYTRATSVAPMDSVRTCVAPLTSPAAPSAAPRVGQRPHSPLSPAPPLPLTRTARRPRHRHSRSLSHRDATRAQPHAHLSPPHPRRSPPHDSIAAPPPPHQQPPFAVSAPAPQPPRPMHCSTRPRGPPRPHPTPHASHLATPPPTAPQQRWQRLHPRALSAEHPQSRDGPPRGRGRSRGCLQGGRGRIDDARDHHVTPSCRPPSRVPTTMLSPGSISGAAQRAASPLNRGSRDGWGIAALAPAPPSEARVAAQHEVRRTAAASRDAPLLPPAPFAAVLGTQAASSSPARLPAMGANA